MRIIFEAGRRGVSGVLNHAIARTAAVNLVSVVVTMFTGILLARGLGEEGRGIYAAVAVWFGTALQLGELGQSAAVTYFVARSPSSVTRVVRNSRRIMVATSFTVVIAGLLGSSFLAGGERELTLAYVVAFGGVGMYPIWAPYLYALQALSLSRWNLVRVSQPVLNLVAVIVWYLAAHFTVLAASVCLVSSCAGHLLLAYVSGRRAMLGATRSVSVTAGDLLRFGLKQASSAVPQSLAGSLDRIVLSQVGNPAALGQYSVAQSVVGAAAPLGTAIASVLFPRLSAFQGDHGERRRVELRMLYLSAVTMVGAVLLLLVISPWAIPLVFGAAFAPAVELTMWVAPGAVAQSLLVITTVFLRGRGTPGRASWANLLSLAVGALSMFLLVPQLGARGAALGAFLGAMSGLGATLLFLRRRPATREVPQV
jgi:O-antigen/teichoic acid export membrane protein